MLLEDEDNADSGPLDRGIAPAPSSSDNSVAIMAYVQSLGATSPAATVVVEYSEPLPLVPITDMATMAKGMPSDPDTFAPGQSQWHLVGTWGLHAEQVWMDYTGDGVMVAVMDDGFEYTHFDIAANYRTDLDYDSADADSNPAPTYAGDNHGTSVIGTIIADDNGLAGVGVAFDADAYGVRLDFQGAGTIDETLAGFQYVLSTGADVMNNSWGYTTQYADTVKINFVGTDFIDIANTLRDLAEDGRNGLGTNIVYSAGNSRTSGDNTNYHSTKNSPYIITVAAMDSDGTYSSFSTPGASLLVAAGGTAVWVPDRTGAPGYNPGGDYTNFSGTSAAAPIVSGAVAVILEANPDLGWRDVQEILAYSAQHNDAGGGSWQYNDAVNWNGGGLHFSHDYGFGAVDLHAAVRLAETWTIQQTSANMTTVPAVSASPALAIPATGTVTTSINVATDIEIEHVIVNLDISHARAGDLIVTLIAPDGTESILVNRPGNGSFTSIYGITGILFETTSNAHWGERSAGTWTIEIQDVVAGNSGTLNSWSVSFMGNAHTNDDVYIYTDDYTNFTGAANATRRTLTDSSGIDTLNFSAVTSAVELYLDSAMNLTSSIGGLELNISSGTVIENVYLGDNDDNKVYGSIVDNIIHGGRNDDYINGRAGNDTLYGGNGDDTLAGDIGNDDLYGGDGEDTLYGGLGNDRLYGGDDYDFMHGQEGDDIMYGNFGDDTLSGNEGADNIFGEEGDDSVNGNEGDDNLYGGEGNDRINGGTGNDIIDAGDGDDYVFASNGGLIAPHDSDIIDGGAGTDTLNYSQFSIDKFTFNLINSITVEITMLANMSVDRASNFEILKFDSIEYSWAEFIDYINNTPVDPPDDPPDDVDPNEIIGTAGDDSLYGTPDIDIMDGGDGNDYLRGLGDDDTIVGGAGNDTLVGDEGNDTLNGGAGNDTLGGGDGTDIAVFLSDSSNFLIYRERSGYITVQDKTGALGVDFIYNDIEQLQFTDQTLTVSALNLERLGAGWGSNIINGTAGADNLFGTVTDDVINGFDGNDYIKGGANSDTIYGGLGNDTMLGEDGDDTIHGGSGNDIISGGAGNDTAVFGADSDGFLIYRNNSSYITVKDTNPANYGETRLYNDVEIIRFDDVTLTVSSLGLTMNGTAWGTPVDIVGTNAAETLYGTLAGDTIYGGGGNDNIRGGLGNDILYGEDGNDGILGEAGDDILIGGAGTDTFAGGAGNDVFGFVTLAGGRDTITDYAAGDRINITDILTGFTPGVSDINQFVSISRTSSKATFSIDADGGANSFVQAFTVNVTFAGQTAQNLVDANILVVNQSLL